MILAVTILWIGFHLIQTHGPNGQVIDINPHEVSSVRTPQKGAQEHFPPGTNCIVIMNNGRINAIIEDCELIRQEVEEFNK
jgi:hypothetical protein